jgi:glyceraldehyde-3-phosphate dehydrogenase (NADP+)
VVPIAVYGDVTEVKQYVLDMPYGQQAAVFSSNSAAVSALIDLLSTAVGRININTQCSRSPDVLPFSGRRSSANGTLSITEALKAFSVETVVAGKANDINEALIRQAAYNSKFLSKL